ncbi:hypothetical protein KDL29_12580 [bacterium]|nr:hypothetical protein [bacterium]
MENTVTKEQLLSKVPEVTLVFWIIKIAATTLGETGGDMVSMTFNLGYLASTFIFLAFFLVAMSFQIRIRRFHPVLYWTVIVATTTAGTTLADFADRSLGIGYPGGSILLFGLLVATLAFWRYREGRISVDHIVSPRVEAFYWATIFTSNTLGTALGDWLADETPLGYDGGALVFSGLLLLVAMAARWTRMSKALLFWIAFILTRPLGATLGDFLTKAHTEGGMELSRIQTSLIIAGFVVLCVALIPQRAGRHPGHAEQVPELESE